MINVSSEFKELMQSRTDFQCNADITFADGNTLSLGSSAFTLSNNSITDAAGTSSFPLGVALSRVIQIELLNDNDQYIDYDFFGAKIRLYLTFALSATVEKIEMGTFTVLEPETYGETVIITARDDMYKADTPYITKLTYPATLAAMFREICDNCDLPYSASSFANSSFTVQTAPTGNLTHRQVLGYIAMIASGNARINREGDVEILSYNLASLDSPQHSLKNWKNLKVDTSDIMITGLQATAADNYDSEDVVYTFGDAGYMLAIENPLIAGQESEALELISTGFVGAAFRKFSGDYIAYPLIEFMDTVEITDRKGKTYTSVVTDINFVFFGITTLSNSAESALRNNSMYVSPTTKAIIAARKLVEKEKTARETAMEQLSQKLEQAGGFFSTDVEQPDGSTIRYLHDKPTLEASGNVIKITAEAIGFSTDGGETYPFGLEVSGDVITKLLSAEGISADWITSGAFTVKDKDGNIVFSADADTGTVVIASVSATNSKVESLENQFNNLEIGGRNLIPLSAVKNSFFSMNATSTNNISVSNVFAGNESVMWIDRLYEAGTYILNATGSVSGKVFRVLSSEKLNGFEYNSYYDTSFKRPYYKDVALPLVMTFTESAKIGFVMLYSHGNQIISGLKLEKGNKATDWTPAPEDVDASIVDKATDVVNGVEIGGRNLLVDGLYGVNSSDAWTDLTMPASLYYTTFGSSVLLEVGQTYTFSVYVDREDTEDTTPIILSFGTGTIGEFRMDMTDAWWTFVPNGQRIVKTFTVTEDNVLYGYEYFAFRFRNEQVATTMRYKGLKLEKGNKATDWTPAPADVENEMETIRETITERYTSAVNTSESIILSALEKYVETSNYEEFKQTLEAQLSIMADEILMNFTTTTEQITNVDGDLQAKFTELYKYISFAGGTITLGSSDSAITLTIENDKIVFKRNGAEFGSWNGDYFYTGSIFVRVNESARFGNFAFLPRDDGSLMLLKVGG